MGTLKSKLALLLQATSGVDSDRQVLAVVLPPGEVLNVFEIAKCPCQKVCRHDGCTLEAHDFVSRVLALLDLLLGHVGQGSQILGHLHLEVESGLEVRLVKTREGSAGVACFELGAVHVVEFVVFRDGSWYLALGMARRASEDSNCVENM